MDGLKQIMYGVTDFVRMRAENAYFVDRTDLIRENEFDFDVALCAVGLAGRAAEGRRLVRRDERRDGEVAAHGQEREVPAAVSVERTGGRNLRPDGRGQGDVQVKVTAEQ